MNYYKILTIFLFLSITLEAAYLRTIRVGAFKTEATAALELKKLKSFAASHQNIVRLQEKWGFEIRSKKTGKYTIIMLEPMRDKVMLQEVIDTLRLRYPDAYVKKLKESEVLTPLVSAVKEEEIIEVPPVEIIQEVKHVQKVEEKIKTIVLKTQKEKVVEKKEIRIKENEVFKPLFFFMSVLFVIALLLLYVSRRKNKKQIKKEEDQKIKNNLKDTQYQSQIQNNENFLFETKISMASVIQYSNLLLEFNLSVIQKDYVQRIKNASETLLNVVNNTADISKIQLGELRINNVDFNIKSMINDVENIISLEAKQNNVSFSVDINEDIPSHVIGDAVHLKQVLISLLTNSVKYTRDGEITLTLKKVYSYAHAITLSFIVSDTGIGMSPEQIDSVMNSDKNNNSTNLCVSKQLIQMMNGDMKIYSTLDVGTTFTFNIKFDLKQ
ncbi:MAG: ATP-binding protein [Sulfurimonas sp.]|nr:ATP-binding protein [Sulfurimonas sp.]MDQ7059806.1 ATP-binding protein [Sulfurimonas sp.]